MNDLIYKQDAIEAVSRGCHEWRGIFAECEKNLNELPSVQPERKKGEWISLDDFRGKCNEFGYKCSECGEHSDYEENFCPNCGADMRSGQDVF